jgi:hypothetical protein
VDADVVVSELARLRSALEQRGGEVVEGAGGRRRARRLPLTIELAILAGPVRAMVRVSHRTTPRLVIA